MLTSEQVGSYHEHGFLPGPKLHVLLCGIVHRIRDGDAQHIACDRKRGDATLPAKCDGQKRRDRIRNWRRVAIEILEVEC